MVKRSQTATTTYFGKPVGANSSLKTWLDNIEAWKTGGGCTWGWYSYDPELNLLYYGSGNPANWNPSMRPGDNRWTTTIFARDVDTGKAKWVYQMTPHDEWDYDGVNEMILADITVAGLKRKVLVHFDKNGFAYTLDRATGELLVAAKYDPKVNWATKVDMDKNSPTYGRPLVNPQKSPEHTGVDIWTNNICPHEFGTKNRHPAAFSPETGLFYVPINRRCMNYIPHWPSEKDPCKPGKGCKNATTEFWKFEKGIPRWGSFIVWDAGKGQMVGSPIRERDLARGGALATAGGLVFYITTEVYYGLPGHACLKAFDLKTSKTAFEFCNAAGFAGDVMTFAVGGRQYVAVFSGNPQQYPGGLGPLLVFALVPTLPPKIVLYCATAPCRPLIEDIREGCKQKWNCPSCAPGGLCPPYHHIIFDKTVQQWKLDLVDAKHQRLPHEITQLDEHVILTFRPEQ